MTEKPELFELDPDEPLVDDATKEQLKMQLRNIAVLKKRRRAFVKAQVAVPPEVDEAIDSEERIKALLALDS